MPDKNFLTKAKFSKMVEETVRDTKLSYMDAIIHLSETNKMELEDMRKFINPVIKSKLEAEAMSLNFLPRQNTLPIE